MGYKESELFFLYSLAETLGKTFGEITDLTVAELNGWSVFFQEREIRDKRNRKK